MWKCKDCGERMQEEDKEQHFKSTGHPCIFNEEYYTSDGHFIGRRNVSQ